MESNSEPSTRPLRSPELVKFRTYSESIEAELSPPLSPGNFCKRPWSTSLYMSLDG